MVWPALWVRLRSLPPNALTPVVCARCLWWCGLCIGPAPVNALGDDGMELIADQLPYLPVLRQLDVSRACVQWFATRQRCGSSHGCVFHADNMIGAKGVQALSEVVGECRHLESLNVACASRRASCPARGVVRNVCASLACVLLCDVDDYGGEAACTTLLRALRGSEALTSLNLHGTTETSVYNAPSRSRALVCAW